MSYRDEMLKKLDVDEEELRTLCFDSDYIVKIQYKNCPSTLIATFYNPDTHAFTFEGGGIQPFSFNENIEHIVILKKIAEG